MCDVESVQKIAEYLGVPPGKLSYSKEQVVTRTVKNQVQQGFTTIITQLARESKENPFEREPLETQCEIRQWLDYAALYVAPGVKDKVAVKKLLTDMNTYLLTRSYLVGISVTLADLAIFYAVRDTMESLAPIEKEQYLNLSRWFNHLQHDDRIRQNDPFINFTVIFLHFWATGTRI